MFFGRIAVFLCVFISMQSIASSSNTQLSLKFNRPADTPQANYVLELLDLAYNEVGYKLKLIDFSQSSALIAANEGLLDGQLGKVPGLTPQYPNLHKIDVPMFTFNLQLLSYCDECNLKDMSSLAIQSNYQAAFQYLKQHTFPGYLLQVKSTSALLNLLTQKQVEAALVIDFHIHAYKQNLIDAGVHFKNIKAINTYHYLHKKHAHLLPRLTKVLNELQQNGTMDRLKRKHRL